MNCTDIAQKMRELEATADKVFLVVFLALTIQGAILVGLWLSHLLAGILFAYYLICTVGILESLTRMGRISSTNPLKVFSGGLVVSLLASILVFAYTAPGGTHQINLAPLTLGPLVCFSYLVLFMILLEGIKIIITKRMERQCICCDQ